MATVRKNGEYVIQLSPVVRHSRCICIQRWNCVKRLNGAWHGSREQVSLQCTYEGVL